MINEDLLDRVDDKQCLYGNPYTGVAKTSRGTILWYLHGEFHREDGPAVEWYDGAKEWHLHGKYHREDGPAVEWADGTKAWWIHGKRHREDGPAVERANGSKFWFIHDEYISTWKEYHELSMLSPQEQMIVKLKYGEQLK